MGGASVEYDVAVEMRDGTVLMADVYRPSGDGPWPVVLVRTPYDKGFAGFNVLLEPLAATARGFMMIIQDTRSRFKSGGGEWRPLVNEGPDGADTIAWASGLEDSTGLVAMIGPSYLGNTQWMAAIEHPANLVAMCPALTWSNPYDGLFGRGGAIELGLSLSWCLGQGFDVLNRRFGASPELGPALSQLIADLDGLSHGVYAELPAGHHPALERSGLSDIGFEAGLADSTRADECTVQGKHASVSVPSFNTAGWFDVFLQGSLDNYSAMAASQPNSRLVIGPWGHGVPFGGQAQGQVNFGLGAGMSLVDLRQPWNEMQLDWLDVHLRPEDGKGIISPKVKLFTMGTNRWRDEEEWPLTRAVETPFYLGQNGALSMAVPESQTATQFEYDPLNPVPTLGGNVLMTAEYHAGPFNQEHVEERDDVLVYTSETLAHDLEVTGRVTAWLRATTDGPSTDWVVRLCDVDESGVSRNIADGIVRAQTVSGQASDFEVDLWSTSFVFLAGHRIRVQVTSSCFPRWDRNLNTGEPVETATVARKAMQTIHEGGISASRILLPVIP